MLLPLNPSSISLIWTNPKFLYNFIALGLCAKTSNSIYSTSLSLLSQFIAIYIVSILKIKLSSKINFGNIFLQFSKFSNQYG